MSAAPISTPAAGKRPAAAPKRQGSARARLGVHALSLGFAAVLFALAAVAATGLDLLSGARAYVGAESLWTKAQKAAVRALHDYAHGDGETAWQRYRESVAVTLSYRAYRDTIERPGHDVDAAARHLVAGGSDRADTGSMMRLHRWTSELPIMGQVLQIWTEGDRLIEEINRLALQLQEGVQRGERAERMASLLDSIDALDARLTKLEVRFSSTLGEAARLIKLAFELALALLAILLSLGSGWLVYHSGRRARLQAEALRASEERFRNAVTGGGDGFWDWDQRTPVVYVSERLESMLGHASGTLPRDIASLQALIHPHDRDRTMAAFQAHSEQGTRCDLTLRVRMADGSWRWMRSRAQQRRDSETGQMHLAGFVTDVHEQQLATLALRNSEARLRGIWETSRDAILIIDSNSVIRHCNPAVLAVLGYQPGELLNQPLQLLQPPELRQAHRLGLERFLATRERHVPWHAVEVRALHKSGAEIAVQLAFALMQEGEELHFISFMRPLAVPAAAGAAAPAQPAPAQEQPQLQAQRATVLRQLGDAFQLSLVRLQGLVGQLLDGQGSAAAPGSSAQVQQIGQQAERLADCVADLRELSTLDNASDAPASQPVPLTPLLQELELRLRPLAQAQQLALVGASAPTGLSVACDRDLCLQLLLRLGRDALTGATTGSVQLHVEPLPAELQLRFSPVQRRAQTGHACELNRYLIQGLARQLQLRLIAGEDGLPCGVCLPLMPLDQAGGDTRA